MALTSRQRSKNTSKRASFNKGKQKIIEGEIIVTSAPSDLKRIAYPGGALALGLLLTARLAAAFWGQITDCDETFNYWEPLHYLVYGSGLQTWEYSPAYAIRSYASLWVFALPAKLLSYFMEPVSVFYTLRAMLAVMMAFAEFTFYKGVCHEYGVHVGRTWLAMALPAAGMWHATAAMLPSSWSCAIAAAAVACFWRRRYAAAVALTAANVIYSWPFTAFLGLSLAADMVLIQNRYLEFIKLAGKSLLMVIPLVIIDSWHYGRLVIAPLNIITYNMFTTHGPNLYGEESWMYYIENGILNFNVVWLLAMYSPVALWVCAFIVPCSLKYPEWGAFNWLHLIPTHTWVVVFLMQAHKEERFLYPVYSTVLLSGAIGLDCLQKLVYAFGSDILKLRSLGAKVHYLSYTMPLMLIVTLVAGIGGVSRITSLYINYNSPMRILQELPASNGSALTVCYGKDWYRSPSSFHLPEGYRIRFIQSDFDGMMPAPYADGYEATRLVPPHFNNQNKGDPRTYIKPSQCHYLVDSDIGQPSTLEPAYYKDTSVWDIVTSLPILDAKNSPNLLRAFYVPVLSNKHNVFGKLYLLRNKFIG